MYRSFLEFTTEGRSVSLDSEFRNTSNAVDIIKKYAPWYDVNCKTPIYRGISYGEPGLAAIVEPSEHDRKSKNQANYTTMIIDNSPNWSSFPDRSKSIICTTQFRRSKSFGTPYRVIPINDYSKFGLCPKGDLFQSFGYLMEELNKMYYFKLWGQEGFQYLAQFTNEFLEKIIGLKEVDWYKTIVKKINNESNWFKEFDDRLKIIPNEEIIKERLSKYKTPMDLIEELLDPDNNNFKTFNYDNKTYIPTHMERIIPDQPESEEGKECWTDSKCLLINEEFLQNSI
jgi:hypothetical protein